MSCASACVCVGAWGRGCAGATTLPKERVLRQRYSHNLLFPNVSLPFRFQTSAFQAGVAVHPKGIVVHNMPLTPLPLFSRFLSCASSFAAEARYDGTCANGATPHIEKKVQLRPHAVASHAGPVAAELRMRVPSESGPGWQHHYGKKHKCWRASEFSWTAVSQ